MFLPLSLFRSRHSHRNTRCSTVSSYTFLIFYIRNERSSIGSRHWSGSLLVFGLALLTAPPLLMLFLNASVFLRNTTKRLSLYMSFGTESLWGSMSAYSFSLIWAFPGTQQMSFPNNDAVLKQSYQIMLIKRDFLKTS